MSGGGKFTAILRFFCWLYKEGSKNRYFLELMKSVLVMTTSNVTAGETNFSGEKIKVRTGHQYLSGFVGKAATQEAWVAEKMTLWVAAIKSLASAAVCYLQTAYARLQQSLQQEW